MQRRKRLVKYAEVKHNLTNYKKGNVRQIKGNIVLTDILLKMKVHSEDSVKEFMTKSKWEISDSKYLVDNISVLFRKPVFSVKNNEEIFYANLYPEQVSNFLYEISSPFLLLRAIENRLLSALIEVSENVDMKKKNFGEKVELLFTDNIWKELKFDFDKNTLQDLLNKCVNLRNNYFHFRDDATDHDILRNTWKILKREFRG